MKEEHDLAKTSPDLYYNGNTKKESETEIWLANALFVLYTHLISLWMMLYYRPQHFVTYVILFLFVSLPSIGITMGYHRLWSHRSFEARLPLRILLAILGTMSFQGSIKWWARRHRLHHRFTDSENDPYNAKRGFWFSHIGWILEKPKYKKMALIDVSDLVKDPVVEFQHRYYIPLAIFFGLLLPGFIAWFLGLDPMMEGLLYIGHVSKIFTWHTTFCINSFAHWLGSQDYSLMFTARGNLLLAIITNGEGHHNFHHEFPQDYRNGVKWYDYDPTKWLIKIANYLGLAKRLKSTPQNEIDKALLQTAEQKLKELKGQYNWGPSIAELPRWTTNEISKKCESEKVVLVIIDGLVYDVTEYVEKHPGGHKVLASYCGRNASNAFNGGLNMHTQAARTISKTMIVARCID